MYPTVKTNILYLSPQALIKMKITASNNSVLKNFIYCTVTAALELAFIIFGDHKEHQLFDRVNKQ